MVYDPRSWEEKKAKLYAKTQHNIKKLASIAFEFVETNLDIKERLKELEAQEADCKRRAEEEKKAEEAKKAEVAPKVEKPAEEEKKEEK